MNIKERLKEANQLENEITRLAASEIKLGNYTLYANIGRIQPTEFPPAGVTGRTHLELLRVIAETAADLIGDRIADLRDKQSELMGVNPLLTGAQYLEQSVCPSCRSDDMEPRGPLEYLPGGKEARHSFVCASCHATWADTLTVTGYTNFKPAE